MMMMMLLLYGDDPFAQWLLCCISFCSAVMLTNLGI